MRLCLPTSPHLLITFLFVSAACCTAQLTAKPLVHLDRPAAHAFPIANEGRIADLYLAPEDEPELGAAVDAFASDIQRVTGTRPHISGALARRSPR